MLYSEPNSSKYLKIYFGSRILSVRRFCIITVAFKNNCNLCIDSTTLRNSFPP